MLLEKLLVVDLHRTKSQEPKIPLILDIPAKPEFLPILCSTMTFGKFLYTNKLSKEGMVRSGVFDSGSNVDLCLPDLLSAALDVSSVHTLGNVFNCEKLAINHIRESSGFQNQPHVFLGPDNDKAKHIVSDHKIDFFPIDVSFHVFLSRPDFVGLYTMFLGGKASIILHNIKLGMSFLKDA